MKNYLLIAALILLFSSTAYSQPNRQYAVSSDGSMKTVLEKGYELFRQKNPDKSTSIQIRIYDKAEYTLEFEFSEGSNSDFPTTKQVKTAKHSGELFNFRPLDPSKPVSFSYRAKILKFTPAKPDTTFVYLLPYAGGKTSKANVNSKDGWRYSFTLEQGDIVYAARKGIVVDTANDKTNRTEEYIPAVHKTGPYNFVSVMHDDGTWARYEIFEKGTVMVKEGDKVYPGTPLGQAGTTDGTKYRTNFSVYYHIQGDKPGQRKREGIYPFFLTTEGIVTMKKDKEYTAAVSEDVVTKEMSKKEIKKHGKAFK